MEIVYKPPTPIDVDSLSSLIHERRMGLNLSRREFAEMIGVVETTVRNWESDRTSPSRNDIVRMREGMRVAEEEREVLNLLLRTAGYPLLGECKEDYSGVKEQHGMSEGPAKTTEIIHKVVLPYLDEIKFSYLADRDTVEFVTPYRGTRYIVKVVDHETPDPSLSIAFMHIVRLDSMCEADALRICNYMNTKIKGKFLMFNDDRDLHYLLDVPLQSDSGPEAFKDGFEWALISAATFHEPLMKVRWAGADFEEALNSKQSGDLEEESKQSKTLDPDSSFDDYDKEKRMKTIQIARGGDNPGSQQLQDSVV